MVFWEDYRVRYLYEEPYEINTYTVERRQYKPDFYLPDYGIYIEPNSVLQIGIEPNRIDILTDIDGLTFDDAWSNKEVASFATTTI